jgi:hypothetical protein
MHVMLKWASWLTKRAHSIGNSTMALLLDDIGVIFDRIVVWLLWTYNVKKTMLFPLSVPLFVVDY